MFGYRSMGSAVQLTTDRLFIRSVNKQDAHRLADYYCENRDYLKLWEPKRDRSYYSYTGWQLKLQFIEQLMAQNMARNLIMLDQEGQHILGIINFSQIIKGNFHACYLSYSLAEHCQGQGLMFDALQAAIRYMFHKENIHRIMASYMPHNQRSGNLLARLGFIKEGYAKEYLMINGRWQDHVLTALTSPNWRSTL